MPTTTTTARNLWAARNPLMCPTFTYTTPPRFECSGVSVYRNPAGSWDYVYAGTVITQRAGFNKESARQLIDDMLNGGEEFEMRSDAVRAHIEANRPVFKKSKRPAKRQTISPKDFLQTS